MKCSIAMLIFPFLFTKAASQSAGSSLTAWQGMDAASAHPGIMARIRNPASLPASQPPGIVAWSQRPYMLESLTRFGVGSAFNLGPSIFSLAIEGEGTGSLQKLSGGLGYGRKMGDNLLIGARFNVQQLSMDGYPSVIAPGVDIGLVLRISDAWRMSMLAINPVRIIPAQDYFGRSLQAGLGYDASGQLYASLEIVKSPGKTVQVVAGMRYRPHRRIVVSSGISGTSGEWWLSAGYVWPKFQIEFMQAAHERLGFSPACKLEYQLNDKLK